MYDWTKLQDKFIGSSKATILPSAEINAGANGVVKLGIGGTRTSFNDGQSNTRPSYQAGYTHYMGDSKVSAEVGKIGERKEIRASYSKEIKFSDTSATLNLGVGKTAGEKVSLTL